MLDFIEAVIGRKQHPDLSYRYGISVALPSEND
jgi:hypothetical protein